MLMHCRPELMTVLMHALDVRANHTHFLGHLFVSSAAEDQQRQHQLLAC